MNEKERIERLEQVTKDIIEKVGFMFWRIAKKSGIGNVEEVKKEYIELANRFDEVGEALSEPIVEAKIEEVKEK